MYTAGIALSMIDTVFEKGRAGLVRLDRESVSTAPNYERAEERSTRKVEVQIAWPSTGD